MLGQGYGIDGFGDRADLVHFYQQAIGDALVDTLLQAGNIGNKEVVAHQLAFTVQRFAHHFPAVPVVFGHTVLDTADRVLLHPAFPVLYQLLAAHFLAVALMEHVFFLFGVPEFAVGGVHGNAYLRTGLVTGRLDGGEHGFDGFFIALDIRGESAFVAHIGAVSFFLQHRFQGVEDLHSPAQPFAETAGTHGHHHEFLEVDLVVGMRAPVEDIHHGNGKHFGIGAADITVKGQRRFFGGGLGHGHTYGQDGIGAQFALVGRAVQLYHHFIDARLVGHIITQQGGCDIVVYMCNGFEYAPAQVFFLVAVAELNGLMHTGAGAARNGGTAQRAFVGYNVHFHSGISSGVQDLPGKNFSDVTHKKVDSGEKMGCNSLAGNCVAKKRCFPRSGY